MSWRQRVFAAMVAAGLLCGGVAAAQVERQPPDLKGAKGPKPSLEMREGAEPLPQGKLEGPVKQSVEVPVDLKPATAAEGKIKPESTATFMNRKKRAGPAAPDDDLGTKDGPTIGVGPGRQNASGKPPGSGSFSSTPLVEKFKALRSDERTAEEPGLEDEHRAERQNQPDRGKSKPGSQSTSESLAPP